MPRAVEQRLRALHRAVRRCRRCPLHASRTQAVPGEGRVPAQVLLVGEAPGRAEDESGRPFHGRAGAFLDRSLQAVEISRSELFITSAVKCRPPENRPPHMAELRECRDSWLERQVELVDPAVVVLLGRSPRVQLLGERGRLEQAHGQVRLRRGREVFITFHPAAAMRFPRAKELFCRDLRVLSERLRTGRWSSP